MPRLSCVKNLLFVTLLLLKSGHLIGAGWSFSQMPADLDKVDVYLHTVEVGNLIFNNFGHTAMRVHDRTSGRDLVFNWGMFDFRDPLTFALNFYRGKQVYLLAIYPSSYALEGYKDEKRTAWEDKIYLTQDQKRILFERLIWNSQPANRPYDYQHFFENCSTRPRDYLDEALGESFHKSYQQSLSAQTFRDLVNEAYGSNPGFDLFLDLAVNSRLDRLMTIWERMFHPLFLREALLQQQNQGRALVESTKVLTQFPKPASYPGLSYLLVMLGFGVPLGCCGIGFFFRDKLSSSLRFLYRVFALVSLPLLTFGGIVGFLMPFTWLVSSHLDFHHNANMLLFWPFDGILVLCLLAILRRGRAIQLSPQRAKILSIYLLMHIIGTLMLPVLRLFGLIRQNIDNPLVWVLPPYLVLLFLLWRIGLSPKQEKLS